MSCKQNKNEKEMGKRLKLYVCLKKLKSAIRDAFCKFTTGIFNCSDKIEKVSSTPLLV
jgi:hypothetical protein